MFNSARIFKIFVCLLSISQSSFADSLDDLMNLVPTRYRDEATLVREWIPKNYERGIGDYVNLIGTKADREGNYGIKKYNSEFLDSNRCVSELAHRYYASINLIDAANGNLGPKKITLLSDSVKEFNLAPGWAWSLALDYTKGDRLLAMQLVGVCGHDDVNQHSGRMKLSEDFPLSQNIRDPLTAQAVAPYVLPTLRPFVLKYPKARNASTSVGNEITNCPSASSAFYYPGSLGAETMSSPELNKRIARIQAPSKGAQVIPAKYYHTIGAAFTTCFLARQKIPKFFAKQLVKGAVNAYRAGTICEKMEAEDKIDIPHHVTVEHLVQHILKERDRVIQENDRDPYSSTTKWDPLSISILSPNVMEDIDFTPDVARKKIVRRLAELDARQMFRLSRHYQKANRCEGPQLTTAVRDFLEENNYEGPGRPCPASLPPVRCMAARHVMQTYLVDFEWTESQHLRGLDFAYKNCPPLDESKNLEDIACKVIKK
jgi:hypothetical protein